MFFTFFGYVAQGGGGDTIRDGPPTGRRPPRDPCWTCGELHWSDECKEQQERKQRRTCLICGADDHWMKACMYEAKLKAPAPAPPEDHLWCLRCGTSEHATARCPTNDPPVNFPPDGDATHRGCLSCGIFGHDMKECLRSVPQVHTEQAARLTARASDHDS